MSDETATPSTTLASRTDEPATAPASRPVLGSVANPRRTRR